MVAMKKETCKVVVREEEGAVERGEEQREKKEAKEKGKEREHKRSTRDLKLWL